jgi:hypothetical protein
LSRGCWRARPWRSSARSSNRSSPQRRGSAVLANSFAR